MNSQNKLSVTANFKCGKYIIVYIRYNVSSWPELRYNYNNTHGYINYIKHYTC